VGRVETEEAASDQFEEARYKRRPPKPSAKVSRWWIFKCK